MYSVFKINFKKGFTLIELLVVVAIIGVLASVVLASLNSARAKARDARRLGDIRSIKNALELYYNDHGYYPARSYDTVYWISDNNYAGTTGYPPCGTGGDGGLIPYLSSTCSLVGPQGDIYFYTGYPDGTPKLGVYCEPAAYQITPYTWGSVPTPAAGFYEVLYP